MATPAPSWQDLYDAGRAEALIRRPKARIERGTRYDMIVGAAAAVADRVIGYAADRFKATYVDGAKGTDLTVLADDHYGIERFAAVPASGNVTFTRLAPTGVSVTIPTGTKLATARNAQGVEIRFATSAPAAWGSGVGGTVTVNVQAQIAGVAGNVAAASITRILDPLPESFSVTNAALLAGGAEVETDDALRARVRGFSTTIRRGTFAALEFGAKEVPGVANATAVEDVTGAATVYVADASGGSTGTPQDVVVGLSPDGSMTRTVAIELMNWRAVGAKVGVVGGALLTVDVAVQLTLRAGANAAALLTSIQSAIAARMAQLGIGETVYRSAIATTIRNVDSLNIVEAVVTLRTGADPFLPIDIAPAGHEIARAGATTVS